MRDLENELTEAQAEERVTEMMTAYHQNRDDVNYIHDMRLEVEKEARSGNPCEFLYAIVNKDLVKEAVHKGALKSDMDDMDLVSNAQKLLIY